MARLGRQVDHFNQVDIDSITADFSEDRLFRYTLSMNYQKDLMSGDRSKAVTVILKNPSSADQFKSDATIRKVETYVWQKFPDAIKLNILNIFAFRATDAIELDQRMKVSGMEAGVGMENDSHFSRIFESTNYLICSWGGPSGINNAFYSARIEAVKNLIKSNYGGPGYQVCGKNLPKSLFMALCGDMIIN